MDLDHRRDFHLWNVHNIVSLTQIFIDYWDFLIINKKHRTCLLVGLFLVFSFFFVSLVLSTSFPFVSMGAVDISLEKCCAAFRPKTISAARLNNMEMCIVLPSLCRAKTTQALFFSWPLLLLTYSTEE